MIKINSHYQKLKAGYLFSEIARRVREYQSQNSGAKIIRLGIGDVTQPLPKTCVLAAQKAFEEMLDSKTFKGYGPEQGYDFLRIAIATNDFQARGCKINADEIFVSDGSKCDIGNFVELFDNSITVGITDPVYPVYVDTNVMAGRTGEADTRGRYQNLVYLETTEQSGFLPQIPKQKIDLIYLCFPNNPTGAVATKAQLQAWVDYAQGNGSLILFDAAYESFITDPEIPHSIYEIEGARECAIEFRSFSKNAGFTGTRCAYVVVPKDLCGADEKGERVSIHSLWLRRQTTKFNGVSYPVQKAAAACYSKEGKAEIKELVSYYLENARLIRDGLQSAGYTVFGGINAPYIWLKTTNNMSSWDFFDHWLKKINLVGTPGSGFGACGEGYFRLSAFGDRENIIEAIERIRKI